MENNNFGQVKISNDVVATIAGLAALEVEGVETNTTFTDKILKNNGVKIQIEEEEVSLDVMVMIDYGVSIPEIALKIQENVKNTVETMTGLKVSQVNIHVQGISFKKEKNSLKKGFKNKDARCVSCTYYHCCECNGRGVFRSGKSGQKHLSGGRGLQHNGQKRNS